MGSSRSPRNDLVPAIWSSIVAIMDPFEEQVSDDELLRALRVLSTMAPPIESSRSPAQGIDPNYTEYARIIADDARSHMNAQWSQLG